MQVINVDHIETTANGQGFLVDVIALLELCLLWTNINCMIKRMFLTLSSKSLLGEWVEARDPRVN